MPVQFHHKAALSRLVACVAIAAGSLLGLAGREAFAEWNLKKGGDQQMSCWIETPVLKIDTGYNETDVQIQVDDSSIMIKSDAPLDTAFDDLGLKVDVKPLSGIERVEKERLVVFEEGYAGLVSDFKAGLKVEVILRFWPTWPTTGPHSAIFSLRGFTKAYEALSAC